MAIVVGGNRYWNSAPANRSRRGKRNGYVWRAAHVGRVAVTVGVGGWDAEEDGNPNPREPGPGTSAAGGVLNPIDRDTGGGEGGTGR